MLKINSEVELRNAILQLETQQADEAKILKQQFHVAYESIKPVNLIKSALAEAGASPQIREHLFLASAAMATGYLSEKMFSGINHAGVRKLLSTVLLFGVTEVVVKNPETVLAVGRGTLQVITGIFNHLKNQK